MRDSGPFLRLPARPSCCWGHRVWVGGPTLAGPACSAGVREDLGRPPSQLQAPHLCPDPGALEAILGATWVTAQWKPLASVNLT